MFPSTVDVSNWVGWKLLLGLTWIISAISFQRTIEQATETMPLPQTITAATSLRNPWNLLHVWFAHCILLTKYVLLILWTLPACKCHSFSLIFHDSFFFFLWSGGGGGEERYTHAKPARNLFLLPSCPALQTKFHTKASRPVPGSINEF